MICRRFTALQQARGASAPSRPTIIDVCSGLIGMRNDVAHDRRPGHELARHRRQLALIMEQLLFAIPSLRSSSLVYAEEVSRERNGLEAFFKKFVGDGSPGAEPVLLPIESPVSRRALLFTSEIPTGRSAKSRRFSSSRTTRRSSSGKGLGTNRVGPSHARMQRSMSGTCSRPSRWWPSALRFSRRAPGTRRCPCSSAMEEPRPPVAPVPSPPPSTSGGATPRSAEAPQAPVVTPWPVPGAVRSLDTESQTDPGARRFAEDARRMLPRDQLAAVTDLISFSLTRAASVTWGVTTSNRASFVPVFEGVGEPYSVYADGQVKLNYARLNKTERAVQVRDLLARRLNELVGTAVSVNEFVACGPRKWTPRARLFVAALESCLK